MDTGADATKTLAQSRKKADAILASNANRLLLIEALLICLVFAALFSSFTAALALAEPIVSQHSPTVGFFLNAVGFALLNLLVVFVVGPVWMGLLRLTMRIYDGDAPTLSELFYYLSTTDRFYRGWTCALPVVLRLAVGSFAINLTTLLFETIWRTLPYSAVLLKLAIGLEAVGTLLLLLSRYSFSRYALRQKDASLWQACEAAREHKRKYGRCGARFFFGFLGWILLGILSIGLLLLIDVVPRMLLTYFCDCDRQTEDPPV